MKIIYNLKKHSPNEVTENVEKTLSHDMYDKKQGRRSTERKTIYRLMKTKTNFTFTGSSPSDVLGT